MRALRKGYDSNSQYSILIYQHDHQETNVFPGNMSLASSESNLDQMAEKAEEVSIHHL